MRSESQNTIKGYVVDIACLRKFPEDELLNRAEVHTKSCALMGHCIESGYGLIDEKGSLHLLSDDATSQVVHALESSKKDKGIILSVCREKLNGEIKTQSVQLDEF